MSKPDCNQCEHGCPGNRSGYSSCLHPAILEDNPNLFTWVLTNDWDAVEHLALQVTSKLNITKGDNVPADTWFFWPFDFDPSIIQTCDGFKKIGGE